MYWFGVFGVVVEWGILLRDDDVCYWYEIYRVLGCELRECVV